MSKMKNISIDRDAFLDRASVAAFGFPRSEAIQDGICVRCQWPVAGRCHSPEGLAESKISGMCEVCFDALFEDES